MGDGRSSIGCRELALSARSPPDGGAACSSTKVGALLRGSPSVCVADSSPMGSIWEKGEPMEDEVILAAEDVIGTEEVAKAAQLLQQYKSGKAALDTRIVDNELWFRMRHWKNYKNKMMEDKPTPASGWLFNSIANKHADAMDNYPEPNVLPRAADDENTAKVLSKVLPVVLEQADYEQAYSDTWWRKLKQGTGVKGIFWDPTKRSGIGDIAIKSMDILMLYWEPGVMDIQESPNLFSLSLEDNDQLKAKWPQMDGHTGSTLEVAKYIHDENISTADKSVVVDWYYKKARPEGQPLLHYCKFCNGVVLYASENDPQYADRGFYDHGQYPFVFDPLFMEEDSPAGFGYIDVMKDTQTAIDEMNHAMDENIKLAAKPRFLLSDAAGVNEEELADWSKDIVHVAGGIRDGILSPLQTAGLQGNCISYRDARVAELKEISGNRDVSQGGTTSGLTAASAIAALQEAGSKLSRDMLKSAYRAFAKECYLIIELMRQFYDEERMYRITGPTGQTEFVPFSGQALRPQPVGMVGGVELGAHEPVFDITVSAAKKSTFNRLSQNETAKECYQMGFFAPANADAALAALDMMDFEGIEKVRERVQQNGTLYQQLQQAMEQVQKMAGLLDQMTGSNMSAAAGAAAQAAGASGGGSGGTSEGLSATNGLGAQVGSGGNSLATQAAKRAMNVNNPNK
nr:MAG TPA: portal protein [Caudoviricetes sp.]